METLAAIGLNHYIEKILFSFFGRWSTPRLCGHPQRTVIYYLIWGGGPIGRPPPIPILSKSFPDIPLPKTRML